MRSFGTWTAPRMTASRVLPRVSRMIAFSPASRRFCTSSGVMRRATFTSKGGASSAARSGVTRLQVTTNPTAIRERVSTVREGYLSRTLRQPFGVFCGRSVRTRGNPGELRTMRRISRSLGCLGLLAVFMVLATEAAALDYVALGDSVAAGAGDGGTGGYVARYRTHVEADLGGVVALQNLAVGGSTSQQLLAALTGDGNVRAAVAGAQLVTLDIGGNDFLIAFFAYKGGTCGGSDGQDCLRQAVAQFAVNWQAILNELRALNPSAVMRAMDYYNPLTTDSAAAVVSKYTNDIN